MTERGYPLSRARVWQLERRALKKLRERLVEFYRANYE
jgi:DNA-directed RNA polymerase sigma subunit (sigma70/sigma32)